MLPNLHFPQSLPPSIFTKVISGRRYIQGGGGASLGKSQNQNFTWLPNTPVVLAPTNIYIEMKRERERDDHRHQNEWGCALLSACLTAHGEHSKLLSPRQGYAVA